MSNLVNCLEVHLAGADLSRAELESQCSEAGSLGLRAVCVNGSRVELAYALLEATSVKVVALVGYPLGATDSDVKRFETEVAIDHGAQEVEVVLNAGRLKDGDGKGVLRELRDMVESADERPVRAILNSSLLTPEEIKLACEFVVDSGVQLISTCTGLMADATAADVERLRALVGPKFGVKATGKFQDPRLAEALVAAGATRIGSPNAIALARSLSPVAS